MKMLKKLALVSAISMISAGTFAMEAMDEESMSATTGQDGITINIVPDAITRAEAAAMGVTSTTMNAINNNSLGFKGLSIGEIRVHDDDGLGASTVDGTGTGNSGALVIGGSALAQDLNADGDTGDAGESAAERTEANRTVLLAKGDKPIQINVDMIGDSNGSAAGGGAMLNVEIKQPALAIKLGNIYVANSNAANAGRDADGFTNAAAAEVDGSQISNKVKIMDGLEIVMAESTMIIQLGNEGSSNHMIQANSTLTGGLTLNQFALYDESGAAARNADNLLSGDVGAGGRVFAKSIKITDNGGTNLTTVTGIDIGSRTVAGAVTVPTQTAYIKGTYDALAASNAGVAAALTAATLTNTSTRADIIAANTLALNDFTTAQGAQATAQSAVVTAQGSVNTANTGLTAARNTEANILVPGATYATLTVLQQGTVDGMPSVTAANTTLTNANNTLAANNGTLNTANANLAAAGGLYTVVNTLAVSTDGRFSIAEGVAGGTAGGTSTPTWGGADTYNGLVITSQLGTLAGGIDIAINDLTVGDTNASILGDIQILGLKLGTSKIVIMGH